MSLHDWLGTHSADLKGSHWEARLFRDPLLGVRQDDGQAAGPALEAAHGQGRLSA